MRNDLVADTDESKLCPVPPCAERGAGGQDEPVGRAAAPVHLPALLHGEHEGRQAGVLAQVRPQPVR